MWILNKQTNCKYDIEDKELILYLLKNNEIYEEIQKPVEKKKRKE